MLITVRHVNDNANYNYRDTLRTWRHHANELLVHN